MLTLPEPYILEDVAVVPGTDGRKMSKSYGNTIAMFAADKARQEGRHGHRDRLDAGRGAEGPEPGASSSSGACSRRQAEREAMFARAQAGGLGYGDVKKDLLARLMDYFEPMRARRTALEARPDEIEEILRGGAGRARALAMPVLEACRDAAGLGPVKPGPPLAGRALQRGLAWRGLSAEAARRESAAKAWPTTAALAGLASGVGSISSDQPRERGG